MLKFKPEDFEYDINLENDDLVTTKDAAAKAQDKFDEWVKSCEVVYRDKNEPWFTTLDKDTTHSARIFDIKEIETECSHNPRQVFASPYTCIIRCEKCDMELKPTGWTEVD